MSKTLMYVEGMDGQVELLSDRVIIHRKGLWNALKFGLNSRREIPLHAISEIGFKPASTIIFGEIEFVRSGRSGDERSIKNNNVVKFPKKKQEAFERLKERIFKILEVISKQHHP